MNTQYKLSKKELIRRSRYFQFFTGWGNFLFFQTTDGVLWGCGNGNRGQLSMGPSAEKNFRVLTPQKVRFFKRGTKKQILEVSLGSQHSLFLTRGSGAFSSGRNREYQLSDGTTEGRYSFMAVGVALANKSAKVWKVIAGTRESYFLCVGGGVLAAGFNYAGQLGLGHNENVAVAAPVVHSLSNIVEIVTGPNWAIFRSSSSKLFGCGSCKGGQFGTGFGRSLRTSNLANAGYLPVEITYFKKRKLQVDFLVSSTYTSYFITSDNQVYCSGNNDYGQFGNDLTFNSSNPTLSKALSNFSIFCSGPSFQFIVTKSKKDGKIYGNGYNNLTFGHHNSRLTYLQDSTPQMHDAYHRQQVGWQYNAPVKINLSTIYDRLYLEQLQNRNKKRRVIQLATRSSGTYLICEDGTVFATGRGSKGQLMDGRGVDSNEFVAVGKFNLMRTERRELDAGKLQRINFLRSSISLYNVVFNCVL